MTTPHINYQITRIPFYLAEFTAELAKNKTIDVYLMSNDKLKFIRPFQTAGRPAKAINGQLIGRYAPFGDFDFEGDLREMFK
jgi:hypothetical protein